MAIVQQNLQTRLIRSTGVVQLALEDETVVLRGLVASDHHKKQVERIVRLEPGISTIRNEMRVAGSE